MCEQCSAGYIKIARICTNCDAMGPGSMVVVILILTFFFFGLVAKVALVQHRKKQKKNKNKNQDEIIHQSSNNPALLDENVLYEQSQHCTPEETKARQEARRETDINTYHKFHQPLKVKLKIIIAYAQIITVFGQLLPSEPLWPLRSGTFRKRFAALGKAIGLTVDRNVAHGRFELGEVVDLRSLRTGGATDLWLATENAMLVQQRGRWANIKNMNIYLQELAATTLLSRLPDEVRLSVFDLHALATPLLLLGCRYTRAGIASELWLELSKQEDPSISTPTRSKG